MVMSKPGPLALKKKQVVPIENPKLSRKCHPISVITRFPSLLSSCNFRVEQIDKKWREKRDIDDWNVTAKLKKKITPSHKEKSISDRRLANFVGWWYLEVLAMIFWKINQRKLTINSGHNKSYLCGIGGTCEMGIDLLVFGLVEWNESMKNVVASSLIIITSYWNN